MVGTSILSLLVCCGRCGQLNRDPFTGQHAHLWCNARTDFMTINIKHTVRTTTQTYDYDEVNYRLINNKVFSLVLACSFNMWKHQ